MSDIKAGREDELRQMVAYHEMRKLLEAKYSGKWVVIHSCQLVGGYGSYDEARAAARRKNLDILDCFIQRVGTEPPIILSYGDQHGHLSNFQRQFPNSPRQSHMNCLTTVIPAKAGIQE